MAKCATSVLFNNAVISCENGLWEITEYTKDDSQTFNLCDVLMKFKDVEGVALSLKQTGDMTPEEEGV